MALSNAEKEEVKSLRKEGHSIGEIAKLTQHSKSTIHNVVKAPLPKEGKAIKMRKPPFDLSAPAIEAFRALGDAGTSKRGRELLEGMTALEAIEKAALAIFGEATAATELCEDYPCEFFKEDPLFCAFCGEIELEKKVKGLEQRVNNASWLIRHALGGNEIEIHCPHCRKWTYLELDKERELWVCKDCRKKPF